MAAKYEIWLFKEGQGSFVLPVPPEEISIDYGVSMTSLSIDGLGEVPVFSDRRARRISFSSIFPVEKVSGYSGYTLLRPETYIGFLESFAKEGALLRLNITGTKINMPCMIEAFKVHEKGGDVGTRYYSISFIEHRPLKMKKINLSSSGVLSSSGGRADNRSKQKTYVVKSGDWLMKIAREQLSDSGRYMEIYNLNRDILKSPDLIYAGQILRLP